MVHVILLCCAMLGDEAKSSTNRRRPIAPPISRPRPRPATTRPPMCGWRSGARSTALTAERLKHLALAMTLDPANTLARGLSGLVAHHGKWKSPAEVGKEVQSDPAHNESVREYLERRARMADTPDAQLKLAAWCAEKGLKEQATAHYTEVTRLDPSREIAWKHLGYKKQGHRWVKPEEAAAEKLEAEHQKRADFHWKASAGEAPRGAGEPACGPARQGRAGDGRDHRPPRRSHDRRTCWVPATSGRSLRRYNCSGKSRARRRRTRWPTWPFGAHWSRSGSGRLEVLALRDPRDVVGRLITLVRRPYKYEVRTGNGPGSVGELVVDGERFDLRRLYQFPTIDFRLVPVGQRALPGAANLALAANSGMTVRMPSGRTAIVAGMAPAMGLQRQQMLDAAKAEVMERNMDVEDRMFEDMLDARHGQRTDERGQRSCASRFDQADRERFRHRARIVEEVVDRPARLRVRFEPAVDQGDLHRNRRITGHRGPDAGAGAGQDPLRLLCCRDIGADDRRPPSHRIDRARRPCARSEYDHRPARHSSPSSRLIATSPHRPSGSSSPIAPRTDVHPSSATRQSSPPAFIASGKPARAGRWPAN